MTGVLYTPCPNCPFRSDRPGYLTKARAREIVSCIDKDQNFPCHQTVDYSGEGDGVTTLKSKTCAGFAILCEAEEKPNQIMQIAERLGLYDRDKLNMAAPVHKSRRAFIAAQRR